MQKSLFTLAIDMPTNPINRHLDHPWSREYGNVKSYDRTSRPAVQCTLPNSVIKRSLQVRKSLLWFLICSGEVIVDCHPAAIGRPAGIHQKGERNAMLGGYLLNNDRCHTIFRARVSQKVCRLKSKYDWSFADQPPIDRLTGGDNAKSLCGHFCC